VKRAIRRGAFEASPGSTYLSARFRDLSGRDVAGWSPRMLIAGSRPSAQSTWWQSH